MTSHSIAQLRAYWEALRDGRLAPYRSEIDPRGIEGSLDRAFILERIAPGIARFRLAGMHLTDLMGMEVRGMPFTSLIAAPARDRAAAVLEAVFSTPQIAEISLGAEAGLGRPALKARMLLLPLRNDLGDMTRAIGCLDSDGLIGRAPRRFAITDVKTTEILEQRPTLARDTAGTARGFAEPPSLFAGADLPSIRSRAHLRLVVSDE